MKSSEARFDAMSDATTDHYLLCSDIFRLGAKAFSYPSESVVSEMQAMASALAASNYPAEGFSERLQEAARLSASESIRFEYSNLFIKGVIPVTESHCCAKFNAVADVSAFYSAFGVEPKSGESPDSIMHELEFAAFLALKVAVAPDHESASVAEDAFAKFLWEHLCAFTQAFSEKLSERGAPEYFTRWALLMSDVVQQEHLRLPVATEAEPT